MIAQPEKRNQTHVETVNTVSAARPYGLTADYAFKVEKSQDDLRLNSLLMCKCSTSIAGREDSITFDISGSNQSEDDCELMKEL